VLLENYVIVEHMWKQTGNYMKRLYSKPSI